MVLNPKGGIWIYRISAAFLNASEDICVFITYMLAVFVYQVVLFRC